MPTWEQTSHFDRDWEQLEAPDRDHSRRAIRHFVADLPTERFRPGLRVKKVQGTDFGYEMTRAPDGRATFQFGSSGNRDPHIIWRRIGRHAVLREL